jgi:hypothetical protein
MSASPCHNPQKVLDRRGMRPLSTDAPDSAVSLQRQSPYPAHTINVVRNRMPTTPESELSGAAPVVGAVKPDAMSARLRSARRPPARLNMSSPTLSFVTAAVKLIPHRRTMSMKGCHHVTSRGTAVHFAVGSVPALGWLLGPPVPLSWFGKSLRCSLAPAARSHELPNTFALRGRQALQH